MKESSRARAPTAGRNAGTSASASLPATPPPSSAPSKVSGEAQLDADLMHFPLGLRWQLDYLQRCLPGKICPLQCFLLFFHVNMAFIW
ncbi:hypothetical protein BAE44_0004484 [Dichanthelium oligosanthes]|uniref:Uncharacterized protein n=1 Tax=Dichanthelium oligosanthes TaxID=888268 RepID=A0A1E5WAU0_9POAL|nr:hypothetical protein BAE44_0004484 [Dichanthelium oligosanthes]